MHRGDDLQVFLSDLKITTPKSLVAKHKTSHIIVTRDSFVTFLFELCWHTAITKFGNKISESKHVYPFHKHFDHFLVDTVFSNARVSTDVENVLGLSFVDQTMSKFRDSLCNDLFIKIGTKDDVSGVHCLDVKQWKNFLLQCGLISDEITEQDAINIFTSASSKNHTTFDHLDDKLTYQQFEETLVALALIKNNNPYIPMQYRIADFLQKIVDMIK